jgi:hypothetical protein
MQTNTISKKRDDARVLLEKLGDNLESAQKHLASLWKLHEKEFGKDDEYLREGSFTDAGRRRLHQLLEEGKRNMEIAEFFGVTDAAIAYHRKRWRQLEGNRLPYGRT